MTNSGSSPHGLRARLRRIAVVTTAYALVLTAILVGAEITATVVLTIRDGTYTSAGDRFARRTNAFVTALIGTRIECRYIDTLFPHPYLGFVHHANPPCGLQDANNVGLLGPDFPSARLTGTYTILVTGGSVASQFAKPFGGRGPYLERMLNERYHSPTGKPFLVLDGGDGAWKQPQQLILLALYADAVNAVVTLEGFNEVKYIGSRYRFEYPAANFEQVNPLASQSFPDLIARYLVGRAEGVVAQNVVLRRSHAAFAVISTLDAWLERRARSRPAQKTTVDSMFLLPAGWSAEERSEWAMRQYEKYVLAMHAIARDQGVRIAHFIQPVPAIGKPLTDDERRGAGGMNEYVEKYAWMTERLLALRSRGVDTFSLLDVFEGRTERLYLDDIHVILNPDGSSTGNRMMSERVVEELARAWKLKPRTP
jgi:hypothetical protein